MRQDKIPMTTRIIINGILGRMGREVTAAVCADTDTELAGGIEKSGTAAIGRDIGEYTGAGRTGVVIVDSLRELQTDEAVIIDFSSPESTSSLLSEVRGTGAKLIIGTTGLPDSVLSAIRETAGRNAVLHSANMSLGVNYLFYLTKIAAEKLGKDFDIEIVEAHHRFKKDSPSGTAKKLGEIAAAAAGYAYHDAIVNGRAGMTGPRTKKEIGMHAIRGGDIVGDHTVLFAGMGERLELRHVAQSRNTFAQGAVYAAKWLSKKKDPGLYTMSDVFGL